MVSQISISPSGRALAGSMVAVAFAIAAAGPSGCKDDKERGADEPLEPLVEERKKKWLQEKLMAELKANAKQKCRRPVLRGEGEPGDGEAEARALTEPSGEIRRCIDVVSKQGDEIDALLFEGSRPAGFPDRLVGYPGLGRAFPSGGAEEKKLVARVSAACRKLPEKVRSVVAHQNVCSPYLPGKPGRLRPEVAVALGRAIALTARARAKRSTLAAARLILDGLRLSQDLDRGGTAWKTSLAANAMAAYLGASFEWLANTRPLGRKTITKLGREVDELQKTEPTVVSHLHGSFLAAQVRNFLIPLEPAGWEPPGGVPEGASKPIDVRVEEASGLRRELGRKKLAQALEDQLLLGWIVAHRAWDILEGRCRNASTPRDCLIRMERGVEKLDDSLEELWGVMVKRMEKFEPLVRLAGSVRKRMEEKVGDKGGSATRRGDVGQEGDERDEPEGAANGLKADRRAFWKVLTSWAVPYRRSEVRGSCRRGFYLAAIDLHLELRRRAETRRGRVSYQESVKTAFSHTEPFSGKPLKVKRVAHWLLVAPPLSMEAGRKRPGPSYRIMVNLEDRPAGRSSD
jgi:hypothetical protein